MNHDDDEFRDEEESEAQKNFNPDRPEKPRSTEPQQSGAGTYQQELQHSMVAARVPEAVGLGTFCTGAIVLTGPHEFVLDFVLRMSPPHRIAQRVVMSPTVVGLFLRALKENLDKYKQNFGNPPALPTPPPGMKPPPISEVYEQLKLPEELMSGTYANAVMIVHTPAEFCFDFVTSFYPKSAVSARVYLAVPHVTQLFDSLSRSYEQYVQKVQGQQFPQLPKPPTNPPPEKPPEGSGGNVWQIP
jgi:hypothetical protein